MKTNDNGFRAFASIVAQSTPGNHHFPVRPNGKNVQEHEIELLWYQFLLSMGYSTENDRYSGPYWSIERYQTESD